MDPSASGWNSVGTGVPHDRQSDAFQPRVRRRRKLDGHGVSWLHVAAAPHDGHDTRLTNQIAFVVAVENGGHQACLEAVELDARIPKPRELHNRLLAKPESGARRQREQVGAACRDVLAHDAGGYMEALRAQLVVEFSVDEVHLAEVRLTRVASHPRAMLDGPAAVSVALYAQPSKQPDAIRVGLAERVLGRATDRGNEAGVLDVAPFHGHTRKRAASADPVITPQGDARGALRWGEPRSPSRSYVGRTARSRRVRRSLNALRAAAATARAGGP